MSLLLSRTSLQATLDALPVEVAVLGADGAIVGVNRIWKERLGDGDTPDDRHGVGFGHADVCRLLFDQDPEETSRLVQGIGKVLARELGSYESPRALRTREGRWLLARASRPEGEYAEFVLLILADYTALERTERQLRKRVEFEKLITEIAARFIKLRSEEVDSGIHRALLEIGTFAGVDRSYVFMLSDDCKTLDNTHEWCADGIEPQIDHLQGLPSDNFKWWMERLYRRETIHIASVAALPTEAAQEKKVLEDQDIRSLVVVPLVLGDSLVGFAGFDSVREEKVWDTGVVNLLTLAGQMLVNALERKRPESLFGSAEQRLREFGDFGPIAELTGTLAQNINSMMMVILGYGELVRHNMAPQDRRHRGIVEILSAAHRASELARRLKQVSRLGGQAREPLDFNTLVSGMRGTLERSAGADIELSFEICRDPVRVLADRARLEETILSLVLGACDAVRRGGTVSVVTDVTDSGPASSGPTASLAAGRHARLALEYECTSEDDGEPSGGSHGRLEDSSRLDHSKIRQTAENLGGALVVERTGRRTALRLYVPVTDS